MTEHAAPTGSVALPPDSVGLFDVTLQDWLDRAARDRPEKPALLFAGGALGFRDLRERALKLAGGLRSLGLDAGDVIAAQLPNGPAFVTAYLAAGYLGATFQTIHMPYRGAEIASLLAHGGAKAFICAGGLKGFAPAAFALSLGRPALRVIVADGDPPAGAAAFDAVADGSVRTDLRRSAAADRFVLLYTSGTLSAPKGVAVTHGMFLPNAARSAAELGITAASLLLSAAPFTHLYGLFSLNLALTTGATTALLPAYTPEGLAQALDRYAPTGLFAATAHMAACLAEDRLSRERLRSLRFAMISGSACPPELARATQALMSDGKVLQLWGMSELQAGSFSRPDDDAARRFSTVGRASPGTELRVMDDAGPAPAGGEGELQVRGPSVFGGYLDNAEASAFTPDGWFRTGDLAVMDEAGFVRLTGRSKDVINRGGVKFNPADVEALIARHPAVSRCAIVPAPDPILGERACCYVVPAPDAQTPCLDDLCRWLASHDVAKLKWPERLEVIEAMPVTPTNKVMKGELARLAAMPRDPASEPPVAVGR